MENDTAPEIYVTGNPSASSLGVRNLEHDVAGLTANNPYTGGSQPVTNYLADPTEEAILHFVDADPARTPTFAMFGKPDYFFSNGGHTCGTAGCVTQNTGFAWDHGAYAAEINNDWVGFVGPGVANLGLDGSTPEQGPSSAGANSGQITSVQLNNPGTWVDETDIQPTLLFLAGLRDDYVPDGRVISEILASRAQAPLLSVPGTEELATCYKQLNSSVGEFGAATLIADTNAIEGSSTNDASYQALNASLRALETSRDALANTIKDQLTAAAFDMRPIPPPVSGAETAQCQGLIDAANALAASTSAG
jgi:hypothetical protein